MIWGVGVGVLRLSGRRGGARTVKAVVRGEYCTGDGLGGVNGVVELNRGVAESLSDGSFALASSDEAVEEVAPSLVVLLVHGEAVVEAYEEFGFHELVRQ